MTEGKTSICRRIAQEKRAEDRLWLAGMAMQALVGLNLSDVHTIARQAYAMADAMLDAERD